MRGELEGTLEALKARGSKLVLGLRDVLDEPQALSVEWTRKKARQAVEQFYDNILIYGLKEIYDPLQGLGLSPDALARVHFTGYLKRNRPATKPSHFVNDLQDRILVTAGGGGDGETLIDWVLSAYELKRVDLPPALIVAGPFMPAELRYQFERRISKLPKLRSLTFEPRMEHLMAECLAVISMGGYNTFCEILSFDKRAILVPRRVPRCEQTIRAQAAEKLGLARWLPEPQDGKAADPELMASALARVCEQPAPLASAPSHLLSGLENVIVHCRRLLGVAA